MFRSMLFTPGNRVDMIQKGLGSSTDALIIDLEDACPEDSKDRARRNLEMLDFEGQAPVFVRVNGSETEHFWLDVATAGRVGAAGLVIPKADDPDLLRRIDGALTVLEVQTGHEPGSIALMPLVESALGVIRAHDLATATPRVTTLLFGSGEQGDLVADLDCEWTPDGAGLLTARSQMVIAARAARIAPMDAVFMDIHDLDALRTECRLARRLGCVGKVAIHPKQLPVIHEVFTPSSDEVAHHRRILELFDQALAEGSASLSIDGQMVDYAVARQSRAVLARAGIVVHPSR